MIRGTTVVVAVVLAAAATASDLPTHPSQLPELTPTTTFPRATPDELASAGYPDHMHAIHWPGWVPPVDPAGETYGPHSLARGTSILPRDGLVISDGAIRYRGLVVTFDPGYKATAILPFIEVLDLARHAVCPLLGQTRDDSLVVSDPDNLDQYRDRTGQEFWRLYAWQPDGSIVVEPIPILIARTLDSHAAHEIMTQWLLAGLAPLTDWPAWFREGLATYVGETGVHLCNYMAQFRAAGSPVLLPPEKIEAILAGPPDPDRDLDREHYREARYGAFLMVWELVEHRGGLEPVRRVLQGVAGGRTPDAACQAVYGKNFAALATDLDCTQRPEPVGEAVQARAPHLQPAQP